MEAALLQIPEVRAARVVTGQEGNPVEVHIVAGTGKTPKQVVRDVQTVALATTGTPIDHRIVSVVQLPGEVAAAPSRMVLDEIATETRGSKSRIRVVLSKGDRQASGEASGVSSVEGLIRLAAEATVQAIRGLLSDGPWLAIEEVAIRRLGSRDVAMTTVMMGPGPTALAGSAVVVGQHTDAVVRSVLDALNRRLKI